jgi:uncharacterized protein YcbX
VLASPSGRVAALFRYPVKSLVGEELEAVDVDRRGVHGDRLWSVRDPDGKLGSGKSSRRFRRMDGLLALSAAYDGDVPVLAFPDGNLLRGDDDAIHGALSEHVGRPVRLEREERVSHFDEGPLHLVTTASLERVARARGRDVDVRRPRANLLVESTDLEADWAGRRLAIGDEVVVQVLYPMPRCVMLDLPQRGLGADQGLLRTVTETNLGELGVVADVVTAGHVRRGDLVRPA